MGCHSAFFPVSFKGAFLDLGGWEGRNYISQSSSQLGFWAQIRFCRGDKLGEKGGREYINKICLLVFVIGGCVQFPASWVEWHLEQLLWSWCSLRSAAPEVALILSLHKAAVMAADPPPPAPGVEGDPVQLCCLGVTLRAQTGSSSPLSLATFSSNLLVSTQFPYETLFCFQ